MIIQRIGQNQSSTQTSGGIPRISTPSPYTKQVQTTQPQVQVVQPSQPISKPTLIESAKNAVTSVFSTIYKAITTPPKPPEPKQASTIKIEPGQSRLTPEQFKQSGMIGIPASTPINSQEILAPSTISQKTKGNTKAPEPTITDIAQNYMDKIFGVTPEERAKIKLGDQMALAQNAYAMKTQHPDISAGYSLTDLLDKSQSPFTETPTQAVSKQVLDKIGINRQMNSKELTDVMMALSLPASFSLGAEGLAPSVLKQLVSLGKFTATSVAIDTALKAVTGKGSFRELLPEDTPGAIKDAVSIADFVGKAYISHGLQPGKLLDVFTKETLRKYNAPEKVYLSGDQIKNIFQDGKLTTAQQKQAFAELGLDGSAVKKLFAKEGITIEMPTENVTRVVDRPWWAKVKEILKVDPAETVKVEKTPAKIVGNEPGARAVVPDQKPVALIGDGKPAVVKANVTASEDIKPVADRSKLSPSSELYQEKAPVAKAEVKPKTPEQLASEYLSKRTSKFRQDANVVEGGLKDTRETLVTKLQNMREGGASKVAITQVERAIANIDQKIVEARTKYRVDTSAPKQVMTFAKDGNVNKNSSDLIKDLKRLGVKVPDNAYADIYGSDEIKLSYGEGKSIYFKPNDPKQLEGVIQKLGSLGSVLRAGQEPIGLPNSMSENMVARERFNIPELKLISDGGSDRTVFDLGDGNVLKITKTARGIDQQSASVDYYAEDNGLIPNTIEVGKNYIVKEKVDAPDANVKKMVSELKKVNSYALNSESSPEHWKARDDFMAILDKYGFPGGELANYGGVLWGDLQAIRNWGTKDGKPIMLDEGSLNGSFVKNHSISKASGATNLSDPSFREMYNQSRVAKKSFGDTDKYTMFRLKDDFKKATGMEITDAQEKQIIDLNQEIFGDQDIKIMGQILTPDGQKALGSYRDGMISILGGKADAIDTFYHEAVHKYFDVFTTKEDQVKLLLFAQEKYGTTDFQATEEKLAEDFINYAKDKKGEGLDVKIREIFDKIIESIKKYFGSEDKIKKFYDDLLSGVAKQKEAKMQEYRNIAQNLPPVEKMAGIKDVKTSLSNIKTQIDQLTTTAKGIATLAQEQRAGLNTKDIAKLKRIYAKSTKFQEGDIQTIRASNTGTLLNSVIEDIQTKYPDLNEQEAFDFALNLPNKANESIKNTPQLRTLREQKKSLDSYMELLRSKEKQLQDVASESTYNEWQSVMNAQEELAKVVEVPRYSLPVEGAGKEKVSRLEARMKGVLKNASPEMIDQLGLSTFNQLNKDENIALASEYVLNNPDEAMRVLSGEIPAPKGILNNAIFVAMERMAVGDVNLARKLASLASTRAGQEIGILSEIDSNSPVRIMRDVIKVKEQAFAKKYAGKSVAEVKKDVVKKIKENIKPPTKDDWSSFIDSIEC